ncbi:hypothetical protein [Streptomyces sp. NPDC001380]
MSAHPYEPAPRPRARVEPTIRSIRNALPEDHRAAFQAEIEQTPLHRITRILAAWDVRARALATPELMDAAGRAEERRLSGAPAPEVLTDAEVRALFPRLRP